MVKLVTTSLRFMQEHKTTKRSNEIKVLFKSFYSKINKNKDHFQYGLKKIHQYDFI